jgi:DNA-binding GntR family transcriptional regulator
VHGVSPKAFEHRSTASRVAGYLRRQISDGVLKPGDRIIELEVSAALGVSRSPIREALLVLSQEGLVTTLAYHGAVVSRLTKERFEQLLRFRLMLEDFAIVSAVNNADDDDILAFRKHIALIRQASKKGDPLECVEADLYAHQHLIALANNVFLEQSYMETIGLMRMYIRMACMYYKHAEELADEHDNFVDALLARDTERARVIMREHIEHGFEDAYATLEAIPLGGTRQC